MVITSSIVVSQDIDTIVKICYSVFIMTNSKNEYPAPKGFHAVWKDGLAVSTETNEAHKLEVTLHTPAMDGTTWEPISDTGEPNDERESVENS